MKKILLVVGLSAFLGACSSEEVKSIEYYKENRAEAESVLTECKKNTATTTENCKNAELGLKQRMFSRPSK